MRAMYDHEKNVITTITTVRPGWIRPPRQPFFECEHAATMPTAIRICGNGEQHVGEAREDRVDPAAEEAGGQADDEPDQHGEPRGDDADEERRARAVHRADEQIASGGVGAEPELLFGPFGTPYSSVIVGV